MWKPSRPRRPSEWFSSALAVLALMVFAGGGAWGYEQWHEQKARDELRTSQLIGCLEAAHLAADSTAATNVCLRDYADRVPALRKSNPYAFVPPRTTATASATSVPNARSAADAASWRPPLSPSPAIEMENGAEPARGEAGSVEPSEGSGADAAQPAGPPADNGTPREPRAAPTGDSADPPRVPPSTSASSTRPTPTPNGNACTRHERDLGLCEEPSGRPGTGR